MPKFGGSAEFEKHACFKPCCASIRWSINLFGAFAALVNVILDVFYAYTTTYTIKMIWMITCILIVVRILVIFLVGQCYYRKFVKNYRPNMSHAIEEKDIDDDEQFDHDEAGNTDSRKYNELLSQG